MLSKKWFFSFAMFFIVMTGINYHISISAPNAELVEAARESKKEKSIQNGDEPVRQDERLYAEVLAKTRLTACPEVEDSSGNVYYNCTNGEKITMTRWTRDGGDRKGIVTRWYDSSGKLRLIFGHPDDVH